MLNMTGPGAVLFKELKRKAGAPVRRAPASGWPPWWSARWHQAHDASGELRSLREHFSSVPDFRGRVEAIPSAAALAMVACATFVARRAATGLKAFGRRFTPGATRCLGSAKRP